MATSSSSRQQKREWTFGTVFLVVSMFLFILNLWLRFFVIPDTEQLVRVEQTALESVRTQQAALLDDETRDLFKKYSEGVLAVDSLFEARDLVFTGDMSEDTYEPVVVLDYIELFKKLEELLGKRSMLSNLTVDQVGRMSFLISTTSYRQAAQQIAALRDGFSEENQREVLEPLEETEPMPLLFTNFAVSSVARTEIIGETSDLPSFLANNEASYDFIVQAHINPLYYAWAFQQKLLHEEDVKEEESSEAVPVPPVVETEETPVNPS